MQVNFSVLHFRVTVIKEVFTAGEGIKAIATSCNIEMQRVKYISRQKLSLQRYWLCYHYPALLQLLR